MTKVSVIIPVYNTCNYLEDCLDSVLNQTFNDFEVICVNDGSTDSSLEILDNYRKKDNRIQIINQSNKGLGAARNSAIKKCTGEYVLFIDSDDYIDNSTLEELYNLAIEKSLDLLIFKLINFNSETLKESKYKYFEMEFLDEIVEDNIFNWEMVKDKLFDMAVTAPAKFFKQDLIGDLDFPENLIFEDTVFFYKVIFKAQRVFFYDRHLYHRRIRPESITNAYFNKFSDCIEIYDLVEDHMRKIGVYEEFSDKLFNRKCRDIYTRFIGVPEVFKHDFHVKIKDNFLKHKTTLENEGTLAICSEKSLVIFNNALESDTYREFELSMQLFELKLKTDERILDLTVENEKYKNKVNILKNSTSWKSTAFLRHISNFFKRNW